MIEDQACPFCRGTGRITANRLISTRADFLGWFWGNVAVGAADACWPWKKGCSRDGYGSIKLRRALPGQFHEGAHRLAWQLHHRLPLTRATVIRHSCDNPPCCNPKHLLAGTQRDNVRDMVLRGRVAWGTATHCKRGHVLTPENIVQGRGYRRCRLCARARERQQQAKPEVRERRNARQNARRCTPEFRARRNEYLRRRKAQRLNDLVVSPSPLGTCTL